MQIDIIDVFICVIFKHILISLLDHNTNLKIALQLFKNNTDEDIYSINLHHVII